MNEHDLRQGLLDEVPQPPDGYWNTIEQRIHAVAAATDVDSSVPPDITKSKPLSTPRRFAWPLAIAAAAVLVLAAWGVGTRLFPREDVTTVDFVNNPMELPRELRPGPRQNRDHWHAAYGVWDCSANDGVGEWLPPFESTRDDTGIHSHADGLIYIHPFFEYSAEQYATFSHFESEMMIDVTTDAITLDDGRSLRAGTSCDGAPAVVQMRRWDFDLDVRRAPDLAPRLVLDNFGAERFYNDREVWTIALAPIDAEIPLPPADRFVELDKWLFGGLGIDEWLNELGATELERSVPAGNIYVTTRPGLGRVEAALDRLRDLDPAGEGLQTQAVPGTVEQLAIITSASPPMELYRFAITEGSPVCFAVLNGVPTEGFSACPSAAEGPGVLLDRNPPRIREVEVEPDPEIEYYGARPEVEQLDVRDVLLHDAPSDAAWMIVDVGDRWRAVTQVLDGVAYAEWHENFGDPTQITLLNAELERVWSEDF